MDEKQISKHTIILTIVGTMAFMVLTEFGLRLWIYIMYLFCIKGLIRKHLLEVEAARVTISFNRR